MSEQSLTACQNKKARHEDITKLDKPKVTRDIYKAKPVLWRIHVQSLRREPLPQKRNYTWCMFYIYVVKNQ